MVLYYRQDNSVADIAAALGVSRDVVRQRLSRGRRMLEKEVAAFVETTLARRKTGDDFVASVLAAIPAGATKAASGSGGISLLLAKLPIAASLLGPVIGLAGGAWGTKQSLDAATSPEERRFLWRCVAMVSLLVAALLTTMAGVWFFFPAMYQSPGFHVLLWCSYCLALLAVITRANRRVVQIKLKCGTAEERAVLEGQADGMLSLAGIRASVVGIVVGCTGWMALLSGILSDWPGLTLVIVAATAILALAWSSLAAATDGKTQRQILFRTTFWTIVLSVVITALRWQAWSVLLP